MTTFLAILVVIASILLTVVVLLQSGKDGGLATNFTSANQALGVRQTATILEKATWWLAGILVVLSLVATISIHRGQKTDPLQSEVKVADYSPVQQAPAATAAMPVAATPAPEADQQ